MQEFGDEEYDVESLMARKKEILLGILMIGLVFVAWMNLSGDRDGDGAGTLRRGAIGRADLDALKVFPVVWASLSAPRPSYDPSGRNIFQFGKPPVPPKPQISQAELDAIAAAKRRAEEERQKALEAQRLRDLARREAQTQAQAPPPRAAGPPPPPPKAQPPAIKYKFIGYLGPPQNKIAVLHDGTDLIFVSRGDELDEKFKVLDIGYESIKFGFVNPEFSEESRTLPMSSTF